MKHFNISILLTILMCVSGSRALAYDIAVENKDGVTIYYNWINNKTELSVTYKGSSSISNRPGGPAIRTTYYNDYSDNVIIPELVEYNEDTYMVTSIGERAFINSSNLTSVTIPNSVISIESSSFSGCSRLTSVTVLCSPTSFPNKVFQDCSELKEVTFDCEKITSLFKDMTSIENVTIVDGAISIEKEAFYGCSSLSSIIIPNTVTSIGNFAFYNCTSLSSVTIPNSVTSIGKNAFEGCSSLTSVTTGDGLTSIEDHTFSNCSNLTSFIIGENVTSIEFGAFWCCSGLVSLTIPNSVTSIGDNAFHECSGLTSLTIGKGVSTFGKSVFEGCSSLASVFVSCCPKTFQSVIFKQCPIKEVTFDCDTVTSLFRDQTSIEELIMRDGVRYITQYAFYGCSSLKSVNFSSSIISVDYFAFEGCENLESVNISDLTKWCGISFRSPYSNPLEKANHLYLNGVEVKDLVIPNDVTSICASSFIGFSNLSSVTIPSSVMSIGSNAFSGCSGLTSLTIPNSVISIGGSAFSDCSGLVSIIIPDHVADIDVYLFSGCSSLTSVTIPNTVTSICNGAFSGCSNLSSFTIPDNVISIGAKAFEGCEKIEYLTFPDNITSIGKAAFPKDTKLYVNNNTSTLLSMWNVGYKPYLTGTDEIPEPSALTLVSISQSTATVKINNKYDEYNYYTDAYGKELVTDDEVTFTGFFPNTDNYATIYISLKESIKSYCILSIKCTTQPIDPVIDVETTASSVRVVGSYIEGDAEVVSRRLVQNPQNVTDRSIYGGTTIDGTVYIGTGLDPNSSYSYVYEIGVRNGENTKYYISPIVKCKTKELELSTSQPKVVSLGNVIISAVSNLDDEEQNAGFEWRRTDWTDDFASSVSKAYLHDGVMEGTILKMNIEHLWKYRPYYNSDSGRSYYGEWVGIDPSNTSFFVPSVHTHKIIDIIGKLARVKGYILQGSDEIKMQGFIYWKIGAESTSESNIPPNDAITIVAEGQEITAEILNLEIGAMYAVEAFATTSDGEVFYGELYTFTIIDDNSDSPNENETQPITISSAKQVTYMSDKDLDFAGYPDLKAYVATGYDKASGTIWLTRVKEVPANTGFLLMGEADTYEIPVKAGGLSAYYQNMFKGTIEGTTIQTTDGDNTNYYLSNGDAGVGFYKVQSSVELKPNRAYLSVPTEIPAVGAAGNTETIKVSAAGQVPYYNSQSLDFSSLDAQGVKAYTATGYDYKSGTIWLTRVKQVPAETGILIMAPQGEYPVPTASVASVYANMFKGTLTGTTIQTHETIADVDYINYYLSSGDAGVGFYKVTKEEGVTIGANRCYLPIKNKDAAAGTRSAGSGQNQIAFEEADEVIGIQLLRGIGDDNDETTNLTPALSKGEGEWYTLQGQRVAKPGKGLYIRNGKVVIVR